MLSCQLSEVFQTKTHFVINVFISFVHDEGSRGDEWEELGGEASESKRQRQMYCTYKQSFPVGPRNGDKNV